MPHVQALGKNNTQSCCPLCVWAPHPWAGRFHARKASYDTVNRIILTRKLFEITQDMMLTELIENMLSNRCFVVDLVGKRNMTQFEEEWHSTWQRPCPYLVQHLYKWPVSPIPTQWVSCTPMICALSHWSNHLRRWKILLVKHSQGWLHTTVPTTSGIIQRELRESPFIWKTEMHSENWWLYGQRPHC